MKCVLHTGGEGGEGGKIKVFTAETLGKCWETQRIREQFKNTKKSKFDAITLPNVVDGVSGYHPQCYKYFQSSIKRTPAKTETGTFTCASTYIQNSSF